MLVDHGVLNERGTAAELMMEFLRAEFQNPEDQAIILMILVGNFLAYRETPGECWKVFKKVIDDRLHTNAAMFQAVHATKN